MSLATYKKEKRQKNVKDGWPEEVWKSESEGRTLAYLRDDDEMRIIVLRKYETTQASEQGGSRKQRRSSRLNWLQWCKEYKERNFWTLFNIIWEALIRNLQSFSINLTIRRKAVIRCKAIYNTDQRLGTTTNKTSQKRQSNVFLLSVCEHSFPLQIR